MAKVVGIKFAHTPKVYYFAPGKENYEKGACVIVETARGMEYGIVAAAASEVADEKIIQPLKPVLRILYRQSRRIHNPRRH